MPGNKTEYDSYNPPVTKCEKCHFSVTCRILNHAKCKGKYADAVNAHNSQQQHTLPSKKVQSGYDTLKKFR